MVKINLGCGDDIREGWDNYDMFPSDERVKYLNLNVLPLPFKDESVDEIRVSQVIEHLDCNPFDFVNDCYRILKNDGVLFVGLPCWNFSIPHLRGYHPYQYLDVILSHKCENNNVKAYHNRSIFDLKSFHRDFSLRRFISKFKDIMLSLGGNNIEWELVKRK